jgi:hypothetical protein
MVFSDYLTLAEYDPRYEVVPFMPRLDNNGLPVLQYPSRPMFPRFYMGENIEWDHMDGRDEILVPSLTHVTLLLRVNIQINQLPYYYRETLIVEPCQVQYHLYRYTYEPYIEEGGFEAYHDKRNKFCVIYVTSLHENSSQGKCEYLALLPYDEPINMLYPRYRTYGMSVYMMANAGSDDDDEVVEVTPVTTVRPREIIDLTKDDSDNDF